MDRPAKTLAANRFLIQYLLDGFAWAVSLLVAELLRYEFEVTRISWLPLLGLIAVAWIVQLIVGWLFQLYRGRYTYGTFEEVRALSAAVIVGGLVLAVAVLALSGIVPIPRSVVPIATPIALILMFSVRYAKRLYVEHKNRPTIGATPVLVYGAGYVGSQLTRSMASDKTSTYRPVGLIDDDPAKRNVQIGNVRVLGGFEELWPIAEATGAEVVVVAIARADAAFLQRVESKARDLRLRVKVMPPLMEILGTRPRLRDMRDISIEDLIGRHAIDTDVASIASYVKDRRVLVTGAGGSIGSELCRQIAGFDPAELIMLDRDETGLQQAQIGTCGHGLLDTKDVVLCDIRDHRALHGIFETRRPEVVFHAAALKHLPMLEQYPDEAWKTNVIGTLNVLQASQAIGVNTFVNISTDKAANPTSVLGHSKRVAEKLTAWMAEVTGLPYISVRFGNVIGSRGSMLPTFTSLIESGGPLTVTHRDATRFFMTIPEACQLVVQAGAIGSAGEVLILDMGERVRILEVAKRMIEMSGKDIEIVFTGLRDGEKLHEELIGARESVDRPHHPKIAHATVDSISPERLDKAGWEARMFAQPRARGTATVERPRLGADPRA